MRNSNVLFMAQSAMIAAIYVVLTLVFKPFSYGEIQVRISESLTILPLFTPAAIPGLFIGCLLANILGGCVAADIIFGSLATLIAAFLTYQLRKSSPFLAPLPPVLINAAIIPLILRYASGFSVPLIILVLSVGVGQVISCGILGLLLYNVLNKYKVQIFGDKTFSQ